MQPIFKVSRYHRQLTITQADLIVISIKETSGRLF